MSFVPKNAKIEKKVNVGDLDDSSVTSVKLAASAVLAGKAKIAVRDIVVPANQAGATVTNSADINGILLGVHFSSATQDGTAVGIVSTRFVPSTGAITVILDANATNNTTVRATVLQAA